MNTLSNNEESLYMNGMDRFPYRVSDVANMLTHPKVNGVNKLFRFLREHNIFEETIPLQRYIDLGYFTVNYNYLVRGNVNCPVSWVSKEGVEYIKYLVTAKLGEVFETNAQIPLRKPGKLTNLKTLLK